MERVLFFIRRLPFSRKMVYFSLLLCMLFPTGIAVLCHLPILALLAALIGSFGGWLLLQLWEQKMQDSVSTLLYSKMERIREPQTLLLEKNPHYEQQIAHLSITLEKTRIGYEHQINLLQSSVAKSKDEVHQLHLDMDKKLEQMRLAYHEFEDLRKSYNQLVDESARKQEDAAHELKHKNSLLAEYHKTISEQRMIIEKKQHSIGKLEGRVNDLMYEIRSLLRLETAANHHEKSSGLDLRDQARIDAFLTPTQTPQTPYDFSVQLNKYIEKVETLAGVEHNSFGKSSRFSDLSLENYEFAKRHLFESFDDETLGIIFIFSPQERRFLFVNPAVKSITGWSSEKFMKEFPSLVARGYPEWEGAVAKMRTLKETALKLALINKNGQAKIFECYMGLIVKGPFSHHIIGILK